MDKTICNIRPAREEDLPLLSEIERRAAERYRPLKLIADPEQTVPLDDLRWAAASGLLWIATGDNDRPLGFALAARLEGRLHLEELDVLPEAGRRGVGRALVQAVCEHAARLGLPAVSLTTFGGVPWNTPFYLGLGFQIIPESELSAGLRAELAADARRGLKQDRVAMLRTL